MNLSDLPELEQRVLTDPFSNAHRQVYADALLEVGEYAKAEQQYSLVLQSEGDNAAALLGQARAVLAQDNSATALTLYLRARNLEGFVADEALETLARQAQTVTPMLRVIASDASTVTPFRREQKDTLHFADVAGMDEVKKMLRLRIIEPFRNPGLFQRFRRKAGGGVLLYGPPGCGKTLMARAIAGECNAEFISVGISEVLSMWCGESERNLADVFNQARRHRPCVLFFDELDALAYSRSKSGSSAARTIVNEFLAQLDGFGADNEGVMILAATNMPWDVDPAMKRPGRFSQQVFIPPPDVAAREAMLRMKLADLPLEDVDLGCLLPRTELFSGADIDGLIDSAKDRVLGEIVDGGGSRGLRTGDFMEALEETTPSTLDWLKTARNLVKFSGVEGGYRDVGKYLKKTRLA